MTKQRATDIAVEIVEAIQSVCQSEMAVRGGAGLAVLATAKQAAITLIVEAMTATYDAAEFIDRATDDGMDLPKANIP